MTIRHYDQYLNSGHEGTNNGIKTCAGKVMPNFHVDKSVLRLCNQGERSSSLHNIKLADEMNSSKPWSNLKCAKYVLSRGLNLMEQQLKRRHYYNAIKPSPDT